MHRRAKHFVGKPVGQTQRAHAYSPHDCGVKPSTGEWSSGECLRPGQSTLAPCPIPVYGVVLRREAILLRRVHDLLTPNTCTFCHRRGKRSGGRSTISPAPLSASPAGSPCSPGPPCCWSASSRSPSTSLPLRLVKSRDHQQCPHRRRRAPHDPTGPSLLTCRHRLSSDVCGRAPMWLARFGGIRAWAFTGRPL